MFPSDIYNMMIQLITVLSFDSLLYSQMAHPDTYPREKFIQFIIDYVWINISTDSKFVYSKCLFCVLIRCESRGPDVDAFVQLHSLVLILIYFKIFFIPNPYLRFMSNPEIENWKKRFFFFSIFPRSIITRIIPCFIS